MEMLYNMYEGGASRNGRCVTDPNVPERFLRNMKNYTENIYVDTHSMNVRAIQCAAELLGEDKILFGSDHPITPNGWGMQHALNDIAQLPLELRTAVLYRNAQRLLQL